MSSSHQDNTQSGIGIDWSLAARVGSRLARSGPAVTQYTREAAGDELADAAVRAEAPVRDVTGLADGLTVPEASILDRAEWISAATQSMAAMLGTARPGGLNLGGRAAGLQAGAVLSLLSGAILGQYDPFTADPVTGADGVLMLVTPNIIATERALSVRPSDFRLWVCLHEVTHRVQFSANPWLRDYMKANIATLTGDNDETAAQLISRVRESLTSGDKREPGVLGLMQLLQSPEQHDAFTRLMMLGTLLEGHADHVMDAVGPTHVPTVTTIRAAFDRRRTSTRDPLQRILRSLIGMDAKISQYIRGKAFVDEVVETVGMQRFNAVWTNADTLPKPEDIESPRRWIDRIL